MTRRLKPIIKPFKLDEVKERFQEVGLQGYHGDAKAKGFWQARKGHPNSIAVRNTSSTSCPK